MVPRNFSSNGNILGRRFRRLLMVLGSTAVLICSILSLPRTAHAVSNTVVISQIYGGGGNTGATYKNDYIELYNRSSSTVDVTGWTVQYASSTGSSWQKTTLSGTIEPGKYYLVQESAGAGGTVNLPTPNAIGSISMSATAGKVALVDNSTTLTGSCPAGVVDFVGFGAANCSETSPTATLSNTTAAIRKGNLDTDNNSADFMIAAPAPHSSATNLSATAAANPASARVDEYTLLTVTVTPGANPSSTGITVAADLTAIQGSGTQSFYNDGTNGDVTAGDSIFSFRALVPASVPKGSKSIPVTVKDAQGRSANASISLEVIVPIPLAIHSIQGSGLTSPFLGEWVSTSGIVTGVKRDGFFIQAPDNAVDSDPNSSEGVYIYTGSAPPAAAVVRNLVSVSGRASEYYPSSDYYSMTEITSPSVTLLSSGNQLPNPITLTPAETDPSKTFEQLEKYEGMRVHVDSILVVAPTGGTVTETTATSTSSGIFYGVIAGVPRPFREPGIDELIGPPVGSPANVPLFDANPERLRVESKGQTGASSLEVAAGEILTNITGPLEYAYHAYSIAPDPTSPITNPGTVTATPVSVPKADEITIASMNLERFYDTRNDPATGDVVLNPTAYAARLNKASLAILDLLHSPDVIGVEEVENLSTLQTLADQVNLKSGTPPGVQYAAYLESGNDPSAINVGFLVNTKRIAVTEVVQEGKTVMYTDPSGTSALLNDRPPLVLRGTASLSSAQPFDFTVIVNHLRSLSGIDDSADGARVRAKRLAQAEYLADLVQARQTANPQEQILLIGDLNAFPFNDGYVDVVGILKGSPAPADQVVLAGTNPVNPNLFNLVDALLPAERYSYSESGNAQVLDQILANETILRKVSGFQYARGNADFPESFRNDATRPERISDHDMPVAYLDIVPPTLSCSPNINILWPPDNKTTTVQVSGMIVDAGSGVDGSTTGFTILDSYGRKLPAGKFVPNTDGSYSFLIGLEASRNGNNKDDRRYTITVSGSDYTGNIGSCSTTVIVPHDLRK